MEVVNLIQGAQEAMDRGDYRLTIAATKHALGEYPHCLSAHRMLGEAYLERADQKAAITHFERALTIDPLNVVSRLGLGVASEETRDYQSAYAHYLHAWELNPALDQVRDELVRIRSLLNVEDKLHPTRAGLAGVHTRAGQFGRALGEWRAVLAAEPESRRARTSIAELLWRQGDDQGASVAAREALRGSPENARALLLLAEIERRRGGPNAEEMAHRYVAADPASDVMAVLAPWRNDADFSFLRDQKLQVADFDFTANASRDTGPLGGRRVATSSLAASQIAAPDLWDSLVHDLSPDLNTPGESLPGGMREQDSNTAPLIPFDPEPFQPEANVAAQLFGAPSFMDNATPEDVRLPVMDEAFAVGAVTAPFDQPVDATASFAASAEEEASFAELMASLSDQTTDLGRDNSIAEMVVAGNGHHGADNIVDVYGATVPFTHEPSGNAGQGTPPPVPPVEQPRDSFFADEAVIPAPKPKAQDYVDPFITADGKIDLTSGWDDLDKQLAAATPGATAEAAFADLLAELNVDGIQPFDAEIPGADDDAWAPFSADDFGSSSHQAAAPAPVQKAPATPIEPVAAAPLYVDDAPLAHVPPVAPAEPMDAVDPLRESDPIDFAALLAIEPEPLPEIELTPDLLAGIPTSNSGYTEILRNIDVESPYEPLHAVAPEPESPDANGTPLGFQELLDVTSTDGTGPLETSLHADIPENPFDFSGTDLEAALPPTDPEPMAYDFDGIVPFDTGYLTLSDDALGLPMSFEDIEPVAAVPVQPVPVQEPVAPPVDLLLGDLKPFSLDEPAPGDPMSFAELDAPMPYATEPAAAEPVDEFVFEEAVSYTALLDMTDVQEPEVAVVEPVAEPVVEPAWAGRQGLGPVARKVLWPPFVNQTSNLMDREDEGDRLFARIAQQKEALTAMGVVYVDRSLRPRPVAVAVAPEPAAFEAPATDEPVIREILPTPEPAPVVPAMSEQTRLDLMAMRARLSDDDEAAGEIADTIERAMSEGLKAPLAQRVLGEAYLKLGQVERAAAQFRQAMLARRRSG